MRTESQGRAQIALWKESKRPRLQLNTPNQEVGSRAHCRVAGDVQGPPKNRRHLLNSCEKIWGERQHLSEVKIRDPEPCERVSSRCHSQEVERKDEAQRAAWEEVEILGD